MVLTDTAAGLQLFAWEGTQLTTDSRGGGLGGEGLFGKPCQLGLLPRTKLESCWRPADDREVSDSDEGGEQFDIDPGEQIDVDFMVPLDIWL